MLIDRIIEERGEDFKYEPLRDQSMASSCACVYTYGGRPSCAVGWMIYDMAPLPETIKFMERLDGEHEGDSAFDVLVSYFEDYLDVEFTEEARDMLNEFQYQQDNRIAYGEIAKSLELRWRREGA